MSYLKWWWENNGWWIMIIGIIVLALASFYGVIRGAIFLAEILPEWIQATIMLSALFVCIFLLVLGSYWRYQDESKEPKKEG